MSLGEAFIEVRADMRPFVRDVENQLRRTLDRIEAGLSETLTRSVGDAGQKAGEQAGDRGGQSFNRSMRRQVDHGSKNIFVSIAGALGSALDDGISALPTEVKAAIVGGILLATPFIGAALGAAINTGLALGVVGLGTLLATQFVEVQDRASDFAANVRTTLTLAARAFGPAIINALDLIQRSIEKMAPTLENLFNTSAGFVEPLVNGLVQGIETIVTTLDEIMPNLEPFINTFAVGLQSVLETIAFGLERLSQTGEDGRSALEDLFFIVNAGILAFFGLLGLLTEVYSIMKDLWNLMLDFNPALGILIDFLLSKVPRAEGATVTSNTELKNSFEGLVTSTNAEEKAARDLIKSLDALVKSTYASVQADIDFEESIDRITESLEKNGDTLDINGEKGRRNAEEFIRGLKAAEERALDRLRSGELTSQQAAEFYNREIEQLRQLGTQAGLSEAEFNELFGEIVAVSQLRISSEEMGVEGLADGLDDASRKARDLLALIRHLQRTVIGGGVAGVAGFADGDIVDRPTLGVFGEAGPEVIIPLTKPARAAQLARESGLTAMLGSDGTLVMVFIGDEQLETRMVKVVERNNRSQAMALNQGPRRF